jgi:hypothetical protein
MTPPNTATPAPAISGMKMSPQMIDAAVIQLKSVLETAEDVPQEVRETGTKFVDALDKWSESMKGK